MRSLEITIRCRGSRGNKKSESTVPDGRNGRTALPAAEQDRQSASAELRKNILGFGLSRRRNRGVKHLQCFDNASESLKCLKRFAAISPRFRRLSRRRPRVSMFSRFVFERGRDGPGSDGSIRPCGPASQRRQCCRRTRIRGQGPAPRPATKRAAHPAPCDPTRPRNRQLSGFAPSPNSTGRNRDRRNLDRPHISTDELV